MSDTPPLWHIVDASGYIFRAYHALPPMNAPDGTPVNAVYGFCSMMLKLIQDVGAQRLLVVFDAGRRSFRQDLYPEYKAHRPDAPADLVPQFSLIRQAVEALDLVPIEQEGFEADDIIATLATTLAQQGQRVCIVSSDKDLMQLVEPTIFMMDPMKNKVIERDQVFEKFGVYPEQVIDVQALAGDSSDNIPGIAGIGLKTAAELITTFGSLDALLEKAGTIAQPKRRERLVEGAAMARLSRELVRLRRDVPLPHAPQALVRDIHHASFLSFLQKLAFQSLVHRFQVPGQAQDTTNAFAYRPVQGDADIALMMKDIRGSGICAFTVTESGVDVCGSADTVWHLPQDFAQAVLPPLLSDPSVLWISHDVKTQMHRLKTLGLSLTILPQDTLVMGYVLSMTGQTLAAAAGHYLHHTLDGQAGEDAAVIARLFPVLYQKLAAARSMSVYETMDRPLIPVLAVMEQAGIAVDTTVLSTLSTEFGTQMDRLQDRITMQAGHAFNVGSPKQLAEVLFQEMKLPHSQKSAKTGAFSTGSDVLETLVEQGHTIAQDILDWRHYAKLKNTYTDALPPMIDAAGRIHTTFSATVTATGRLSSSDPNLQNIPVRSTEGQKIRTAFYAPPESVLISCDYSQIELRLLAHLANIETLQQAFHTQSDIHTLTAHHVFGVPLEQVTPALRYRAKAVNFGMIYGITPFGLAKQLGCTKAEAKAIMDAYFARYPGIQTYMTTVLEQARRDQAITTLFGRRIPLSGLGDNNPARRAFAERAAINAPLQGAAADLIKRAMIRVADLLKGYRARMILQVHDELVFEVPAEEQNTLLSQLVNVMETAHLPDYALSVPLVVDASVGQRWE